MKRTIKSKSFYLLTIGLVLLSLASCKTEIESKLIPVVSTEEILSITQNTAVSGGEITSDNGLDVTSRGVCWGLKPNPTITDSLTKNAAGTGKFVSQLSNLVPDTTYYVRAYATNSDGTAYGLQVTFRTLKAVFPVLTTTKATDLTDISATSGGNISFNGGTPVIKRGVCWGTNPLPTIVDNTSSNGIGDGAFSSSITGLTTGTTYYIRAYATNKAGTGYGTQDTIKTLAIPTVTTTTAQANSSTTATSGGTISADGGTSVTSRGVCWNTTGNPTITDNKTTDGTGTGTFSSLLNNLTTDITYYIRAYATNKIGTGYGSSVIIKTSNLPTAGLVAWYPFNGNANDESGNGNNGKVNGATLTNDRFGNDSKAYYYKGTDANSYISASINTSQINGAFTISFWCSRSGNGYLSPRIMKFYANNDGLGTVAFGWANGAAPSVIFKTQTQTPSYNYNTVSNNTWTHMVLISNGISVKLYQNGVLINSNQVSGLTLLSGNLNIGRMTNPDYDSFNGKIDDIGIWSRALTQDEIFTLYNLK